MLFCLPLRGGLYLHLSPAKRGYSPSFRAIAFYFKGCHYPKGPDAPRYAQVARAMFLLATSSHTLVGTMLKSTTLYCCCRQF